MRTDIAQPPNQRYLDFLRQEGDDVKLKLHNASTVGELRLLTVEMKDVKSEMRDVKTQLVEIDRLLRLRTLPAGRGSSGGGR
jgi:hypothetical protein